jgi:hypothetical protein
MFQSELGKSEKKSSSQRDNAAHLQYIQSKKYYYNTTQPEDLYAFIVIINRQDSSLIIVASYGFYNRRTRDIHNAKPRNFLILQRVQAGFGSQEISYKMGIWQEALSRK